MFQEVKIKLALMFTLIVSGLQMLFSFGFLLHQMFYYGVYIDRLFQFAIVLTIEIFLISIITFIVGYFFVKETVKPAEDMFERLDQFTIDASHELKTPLGIANSSLDLALKTKEYKKYISESKTHIKRASSLVEKMLELARLDQISMSLTMLSFNHSIDRVIKTCSSEIKKKGILLVSTMNDEIKIKADPVLLERTISNLIENAIKFNHQGGRIEITLSKGILTIANTGKKIEQENLVRIFDRFYQTESSRSSKGHGIGLAIVKKICDLHGWKISVESSDVLTTFTILFRS